MFPKYRAWHPDLSLMLDVSLVDYKKQLLVGYHWRFGETDFISFDEVALMESIGLFDKNKQEVFEGDIITNGRDILLVKKHNTLGFYVEKDGEVELLADGASLEEFDEFAEEFADSIEILGNVYQNQNLLEK